MVLEEISQLIEDCNSKRDALTVHRDKINTLQKQLLKFAAQSLPKDDLTDLEHYQNQFHIQLINIHDLRHDLKAYQQRVKVESHFDDGVSAETMKKHQDLAGQYNTLEGLLTNLENDFSDFLKKPHDAVA